MCRIVIDLLIIVSSITALVAYTIERRKVKAEMERLRTLLAQEYAKPGSI